MDPAAGLHFLDTSECTNVFAPLVGGLGFQVEEHPTEYLADPATLLHCQLGDLLQNLRRKSGRLPVGMDGRFALEWVAAFDRNGWPGWLGICNFDHRARGVYAQDQPLLKYSRIHCRAQRSRGRRA